MFAMETYNFNEEDKFSLSKSGTQPDIAGLLMQCRELHSMAYMVLLPEILT